MYTKRLREWNVVKNIVSHDVQEYLQRSKNPIELTSPDGSSSIKLRGRMVTKRRLLNHMKRRKITHYAESNEAEVEEDDSTSTRNALSENTDEHHANLNEKADEVPYQDCERIPKKDEVSINLTSEELTSLSVAMLQTDFHYRGNSEDTSPVFRGKPKKQVLHPLVALSRAQLLAGPPELRDLAFILHHSNVAYARFPNARNPSSPQPFQMAARQQSQAKDMYARHWLAGRLASKGVHDESLGLLSRNTDQLISILLGDHPHFLPYIAFVVCYQVPFDVWNEHVHQHVVEFSLKMSKLILKHRHPYSQILERLMTSDFSKSICLVLLRQVISNFRRELQSSHMKSLDLLAQLFDTIEDCESFDGNVVEETLRRWAEGSLTIANVIKEEKRTARMKAERDAFDPVHQAAATNRNGNACFSQEQGLFTGK